MTRYIISQVDPKFMTVFQAFYKPSIAVLVVALKAEKANPYPDT